MLWYKSWLDTRSRFLLGLARLARVRLRARYVASRRCRRIAASSCREGLPRATATAARAISRSRCELQSARFAGYAWSEWFAGNLPLAC